MQEFDRRIRTRTLGIGRERKGEACLLTPHHLELDIRTPARGFTRGRDLTRSRGGARCAPGKNGEFPFTILKPRAEGYETEIVANLAFWGPINRVTCMRKPQALNALTVWVFASDETRARRLTAAKLHGTSPRGEQSSTEAVAEVQMDDRKIGLGQKSQQRRVMWPLREGREIWGVDGAFASMNWRRHCVRDGVAPSANELAWFYMGSDSVTQWAFPMRKSYAALSYLWKRTKRFREAGYRGPTIMYSIWKKYIIFFNIKACQHILLHQIHKIVISKKHQMTPLKFQVSGR